MSANSLIEWTDCTDNIIVAENGGWWCRKCSEGCDNCFSEEINQSDFFKGNKQPYTGDAPRLLLRRDIIRRWKRQRKSQRHFVSSMTDIFGEWVPKEWCFEFLDGMAAAPRQTFQLLTKRARRMAEIVNEWLDRRGLEKAPKHMQFGVSVENQKWADVRIPYLLQVRCWVRFLSCEPLLGAIYLSKYILSIKFEGRQACRGIHWIICGGESGPNARPMHPDWARSLRDQGQAAGVPFFFKQHGEWLPDVFRNWRASRDYTWGLVHQSGSYRIVLNNGERDWNQSPAWNDGEQGTMRVGKKIAGRLLDGREWNEFPEVNS